MNYSREQILAMIDALAPFAKVADELSFPSAEDKDYESVYYHDIRVGHFRAAKKALEGLL